MLVRGNLLRWPYSANDVYVKHVKMDSINNDNDSTFTNVDFAL